MTKESLDELGCAVNEFGLSKWGMTKALKAAVVRGNLMAADLLLEKMPFSKDNSKTTDKTMMEIVSVAVGMGYVDLVTSLLEKVPFSKDDLNHLMVAAVTPTVTINGISHSGHNTSRALTHKMIRLLADRGADKLDEPMRRAAYFCDTDTVMLLHSLGASNIAAALEAAKCNTGGMTDRHGVEKHHDTVLDTIGVLRMYMRMADKNAGQKAPAP